MTNSTDLLWRVVFLFCFHHRNPKQISETLFLSESTVYRVLKRFRLDRDVRSPGDIAGHAPRNDKKLSLADLYALNELVIVNPTVYLDELRTALINKTGTSVSLPTICRALRHQLLITRKMVSRRPLPLFFFLLNLHLYLLLSNACILRGMHATDAHACCSPDLTNSAPYTTPPTFATTPCLPSCLLAT